MKKYKINFPINGNPYDYYVNDSYDLMNSRKRIQNGYDYNCNMDYSVYDKQPYMPIGGTPIQMPNKRHDCDKDREYMKEMYPNLCKKIQRLVDEECDRMEYDGSYMYDEYPDKEAIEMITDKIYDQMDMDDKKLLNEVEAKEEDVEVKVNQSRNRGLRDLIKVILLNEMFNRRNRKYNRPYRNNRNYNRYYNPYDYSNYYYDNMPYGYYF